MDAGGGFLCNEHLVYEGSYALAHTGAQSQAVSREIELEEDVTYYVSAHVRNSTAEDKVTLSIGGYDLESGGKRQMEELSVKIVGGGTKEQLVITATGNTTIDGVSVRPFKEGEELIGNGSFTDKADPWHSLSGLYYESGEVEGHTGVIGNSITGGVATAGTPGIGVEAQFLLPLFGRFLSGGRERPLALCGYERRGGRGADPRDKVGRMAERGRFMVQRQQHDHLDPAGCGKQLERPHGRHVCRQGVYRQRELQEGHAVRGSYRRHRL